MFKGRETKKARDVVAAAMSELAAIWQVSDDPQDWQIVSERMRRWRDRFRHELFAHVSERDGSRFGVLTQELDFHMTDRGDTPRFVNSLVVFLKALDADIEAHPTEYDRPRPRTALVRRAQTAGALEMPDKITWSWLVHHVPVGWWLAAGTGLLALLVFAFWFGHVTPDSSWIVRLLKAPG